MATSKEFIDYVVEQIDTPDWVVYSRKMFGEYMIYLNDKPALLVCDNVVYVKKLPEISGFFGENKTDFPYDGAKEHYILDIDNGKLSKDVLRVLVPILKLNIKKKR